ncbi:DNA-binding transcriptional regulator, LysR family [Gulbenkiania indica]|uniref:DNA-binding transcriptional regulator, LysR family n=1 Tax=Gulbenkiania indica TaxID=375574 RepID=A0A0K6H6P4_9NEIS|nr:LysR family transcriptional regulator [Gulbenkiania indica]CUA86514.1 DNA-binding transcriptional regulator, LysR family [Gulbenkiania indica]
MDIRALRYFIEVIRRESFTRAAEALFVTQPTISKMVRQLEEELGTPLLIREGKRFRLTDAGRVTYQRGQEVLTAMQHLRTELADLEALETGELVVGLPPMVGGAFFAPVVSAFRERYPRIELSIVEGGARAIENSVRTGELEVGVAVLPVDHQVFSLFPFVSDPLCLVAPSGSRWQGRQSVRLSEVADEPVVFYPEDFTLTTRILDAYKAIGRQIHIAGRSAHWDFIVAMVAARLGIALLPRTIAGRLQGQPFDVVPLAEKSLYWNLALIWRQDSYLSHAARAWLELARNVLGNTPNTV